MQIVVLTIAGAMILVAAYCIAFNWASVFINARRRARQEPGHVSMIFLVPQLFLATAYLLIHIARLPYSLGLFFLLAALCDAAPWALLLHLLQQARRTSTDASKTR